VNLTICNEILDKLPNFRVVAYEMTVQNGKRKEVDEYLEKLKNEYSSTYLLEDVVKIPKIKETRDGYKLLGKDPSHTRPACEAILRRFVKKEGIYRLGDIIDVGNILSLVTKRSVCVVDSQKLYGNITIRLGAKDEPFEAINRGSLNVYKLPVYSDELGPFGSPTSDTVRTSVTSTTKNILVMLICFSENEIKEDTDLLLELYKKYLQATNIKEIEVIYGKF